MKNLNKKKILNVFCLGALLLGASVPSFAGEEQGIWDEAFPVTGEFMVGDVAVGTVELVMLSWMRDAGARARNRLAGANMRLIQENEAQVRALADKLAREHINVLNPPAAGILDTLDKNNIELGQLQGQLTVIDQQLIDGKRFYDNRNGVPFYERLDEVEIGELQIRAQDLQAAILEKRGEIARLEVQAEGPRALVRDQSNRIYSAAYEVSASEYPTRALRDKIREYKRLVAENDALPRSSSYTMRVLGGILAVDAVLRMVNAISERDSGFSPLIDLGVVAGGRLLLLD